MKKITRFMVLVFVIPFVFSCADDLTGPAGADAAATPNVSIRGGGLIEWTLSDNRISFTEDIVIRDHARGSVYTITPAASPITLPEAQNVAYVELSKASGETQSITSTTISQSGSLETTGENTQAVTLFERTNEETIYIPWVQKELITGDHWRLGTTLTWYERISIQAKPSYKSEGGTEIIVPASQSTPAVVTIDGKLYANTTDQTSDLATEGRGGLDTGTIAANTPYYLYAIPAEEGRTFDLVTSTTDPSTGLTGFSSWSYIGAAATDSGSAVFTEFQSSNGIYLASAAIEQHSRTTSGTTPQVYDTLPVTATKAYFRMYVNGTNVGESGYISGTSSGLSLSQDIQAYQASPLISVFNNGWISIFTSKTVYVTADQANVNTSANLQGWQENPMAYK